MSSRYSANLMGRSLWMARLLGPTTGFLWFLVAGWVLVMAAGAAGVGISTDQTPFGPWLVVSLGMGLFVLVGGRWWPVLLASAITGVALALAAQGDYRGSTSDFLGGLDVMVGLSLGITAWSVAIAAIFLSARAGGRPRRGTVPRSRWGTEIRWLTVNCLLAIAIWLGCVATSTLLSISANGSLEGWEGSPPEQALGIALLSVPFILILGTPTLGIALTFWRAGIRIVGHPRLLAYLVAALLVVISLLFDFVPGRYQSLGFVVLPAFVCAALLRLPVGWSPPVSKSRSISLT